MEIRAEHIKNTKGIVNAHLLFEGKAPARDWQYKGVPEFEVHLNALASTIEYLDGNGILKDNYFTIHADGKEIARDKMDKWKVWKTVNINGHVSVLKFRGSLMPEHIKISGVEMTTPEVVPNIIFSDQSVSFSGVYGHYLEIEGKFVIILDEKPGNLKVSNDRD